MCASVCGSWCGQPLLCMTPQEQSTFPVSNVDSRHPSHILTLSRQALTEVFPPSHGSIRVFTSFKDLMCPTLSAWRHCPPDSAVSDVAQSNIQEVRFSDLICVTGGKTHSQKSCKQLLSLSMARPVGLRTQETARREVDSEHWDCLEWTPTFPQEHRLLPMS